MRLLFAAAVAALGLAGLAQASAAGGGAEGVPRFGHVFVIIGENTDYQHLTTTNAPSRANAWAIARPIPPVPPVTRARRPCKRAISISGFTTPPDR